MANSRPISSIPRACAPTRARSLVAPVRANSASTLTAPASAHAHGKIGKALTADFVLTASVSAYNPATTRPSGKVLTADRALRGPREASYYKKRNSLIGVSGQHISSRPRHCWVISADQGKVSAVSTFPKIGQNRGFSSSLTVSAFLKPDFVRVKA